MKSLGCWDKVAWERTSKALIPECPKDAVEARKWMEENQFEEVRSGELNSEVAKMNVTAPPKFKKSWLVLDLALALATGRPWLNTFATEPSQVLPLDNELHAEPSGVVIPAARGR